MSNVAHLDLIDTSACPNGSRITSENRVIWLETKPIQIHNDTAKECSVPNPLQRRCMEARKICPDLLS